MAKDKIYKIRDIERILDVKRESLFYWEKTGKISKAKRERMSNYRYWTEEDVRELKRIVTGRG